MTNIAFFASGNGTNVQAILDAIDRGEVEANPVALVCDKFDAPVIDRVRPRKMDTLISSPKNYEERETWEEVIVAFLKGHQVDLVVLAGFMRIVGQTLLDAYPNRIINIHPALLPNYPGRHGIEDAYNDHATETGVTVHYVDSGIDSGPIIRQEKLKVDPSWSLEELETHIHDIEHRLYPEVIQEWIEKHGDEDNNDKAQEKGNR